MENKIHEYHIEEQLKRKKCVFLNAPKFKVDDAATELRFPNVSVS